MGISELISAFVTTIWQSQLQHLNANEAAPLQNGSSVAITLRLVIITLLHDVLQGTYINFVGLIKGSISTLIQHTFSTVIFTSHALILSSFLILQRNCCNLVILLSICLILIFPVGLERGSLFIFWDKEVSQTVHILQLCQAEKDFPVVNHIVSGNQMK